MLDNYRDDTGNPSIFKSVVEAEKIIKNKYQDKEYSYFSGMEDYNSLAVKLLLGDDSVFICQKRTATVQAVGGSGALYVSGKFMAQFFPGNTCIYLPQPTWANHEAIFKFVGLEVAWYRYCDPKVSKLDFEGLMDDINKIPEKSIAFFQGCAHNPTGVDPSQEQWCEISQLVKKRQLFPVFDVAYQGFASGDFYNDAFSFRTFLQDGHKVAILQSYSKSMGLYGERTGSCTFIADCKSEADTILTQMEEIIRKTYSSPPIHGSRIVVEILADENLKYMWFQEVKMMSERLKAMRNALKENLEKAGSKHNWDHIVHQIGMFCLSKLTPKQVKKLTDDYHIYLPADGRISVAGLTTKNVQYVANAIHEVTK
ncbi:unnamed protein product [Acanthoscelides obtectus]|uniref:Aspartate aminotransferase, mitochondrial n=1 Tax=Acanthoscelides obtectus TaxID=200917 RepID=A0A9P0P225_ACAOB|nr:unnamed protein product [Acanthoscelides obtectus]CAK1623900.1 Aspartate aminotransferase, mitochondrial [Acanthoscelides obtectus]